MAGPVTLTLRHHATDYVDDAAAVTSVPLALLAFLQYPDQPAEAIRYAIRAGGDTDTIASMV